MKRYGTHILIGLVCGFLNGLFGAGGGSVVVPAMEKLLQLESKRAHATAIGIILLMSAVSAALYIKRGFFDLRLWVPTAAGGVLGGLIGANALSKIPKRWLKLLFGSVIVITAIKMVI